MSQIKIVPIAPEHRADWEALYQGYADFYRVQQSADMRATVWSWIFDPTHEVEGLVAIDQDGRAVGLAHFRPFSRPLRACVGGFLDDLFVDPRVRGQGVAQALIGAVAEIGRRRAWNVVRWITAEDNYRARAVYDRVAKKTPWLTYDISLE